MKTWDGITSPDPDDRVLYAAMETEEELDFEYTGLYLIVWGLRGRFGPAPDSTYLPDARAAVGRILDLDMGVLRRAIWTQKPFGPALDRADLQDEWFADPDEATCEYIVIDTARERPPQPKP